MPYAQVNGVRLYYEETGSGTPLVFVHEFAGDHRSWEPQVRHFARTYRCVVYDARGYPPSDVPDDAAQYSQDLAVADLLGVLEHMGLAQAHICGFSMGGYAALLFGLRHPERCRSLVLAGTGYGSDPDRSGWERDVEAVAARMAGEGMTVVGETYGRGPTRVQYADKDPRGFAEFLAQLKASSSAGHANTMRGVQKKRPSVLELAEPMRSLRVPTLIVTGDEDEPCLEPGLFMKRHIPASALVVLPRSGHAVNLEEPERFNREVGDFLSLVDAGRWGQRNPASVSASAILPPAGER